MTQLLLIFTNGTYKQLETTPYCIMAFSIAVVTEAVPPILAQGSIVAVFRVAPTVSPVVLHVPGFPLFYII